MRPNPYVGPRPFRAGETLYGRDHELRRLLDLLIAERLVLLHAPSGAGKSSLVHAALAPRLRAEGFAVLPPIRVGLEPPAADAAPAADDQEWLLHKLLAAQPPGGEAQAAVAIDPSPAPPNRYLLSAMLSLEEALPPAEQLPLAQLAAMSLDAYLERREARLGPHDGVLLIFDQLEEILTADPTDVAAKESFFAQVGAALFARHRWALFAIRDDYVGAIEPHLRPIPTQLGSRFRLDLLERKAALEAMQRPVLAAGASFSAAAAARLCDDLRRVRVLHADGSVSDQLGPYVEPVQLQVVCYRLWARLPADDTSIDPEDVAALGDVDEALTDYYVEQVGAIAAATGVSERAIRDWCEHDLITEHGIRGQVLSGAARLNSRAIGGLIDAHLVRGERRRGATWLELAHDRLVGPVRADNATWRDANLSPLQRQAALWVQQGRPDGLLLRDNALTMAEGWAAVNAGELGPSEREFLLACGESRELAERERRVTRRIRRLGIFSSIAGALALIAAIGAFFLWRSAVRQGTIAELRRLEAQATSLRPTDPQTSLLLSLEAIRLGAEAGLPPDPATEEAMRQAQARIGGAPLLGHTAAVELLAFSPDGATLASSGDDGSIRIWPVGPQPGSPTLLLGHTAAVQALAFSPDGSRLASGGDDATVRIWSVANWGAPPLVLGGRTQQITSLAFSPDGAWLASGSADGAVQVWPTADESGATITLTDAEVVSALVFSPDGAWLAAGGGETVVIWRAGAWRTPTATLSDPALWGINQLSFSPDGRELAAAGVSGAVTVWQVDGWERLVLTLPAPTPQIFDLAYSPDSSLLAAAAGDGTVLLWNDRRSGEQPRALAGHTLDVWAIAFSPDGTYLASGSDDHTIQLWAVGMWERPQATLVGHKLAVTALTFSTDGAALFSGSDDWTARVWRLAGAAAPQVLAGPGGQLSALSFSPDGALLAAGYDDGAFQLWATGSWQTLAADPAGTLSYVAALTFSPDGRYVAYSGNGGAIVVWALGSRPAYAATLEGGDVYALAFSPDGGLLASAGRDGAVRLWSTSVWRDAPQLLAGERDIVSQLAFSPDGSLLAVADISGRVELWAAGEWAGPRALAEDGGAITALAFSLDGRFLAAGDDTASLRLWDLHQLEARPVTLEGHVQGISALAFSPDSRLLASGSADRTVRVWTLGSLASAPVVYRGHGRGVVTLAFSPDGSALASAGDDQTVLRWRVGEAASPPVMLGAHDDTVGQLAWSPGGSLLASGSWDGTVRVWPAELADAMRLTCQVVGSNLSWEEWHTYFGDRPYSRSCPDVPTVPSLVASAALMAQEGRIDEALELVDTARRLDMEEVTSALAWFRLCWWGSLAGRPQEVMGSCDRAVMQLPDNADYREARGLARALAGDPAGAIEDFEAVARLLAGMPKAEVCLRWAGELRAGRSPFDEATLAALRQVLR
jgi:WD40 repeat protein